MVNNVHASWKADMEAFRDNKHVHCKLSGLVTENGPNWTPERIQPYLETVFDIFGAERLVFGSDWPVVNQVSDYSTRIETLSKAIDVFTPDEQQAIWAENGSVSKAVWHFS